ncbi:DUF982 domain-containing protein [Marinibacterium profundimaris]|uniref:DUF982 domain-containing protein n=1 Tax=Marinibacterium profundimaris TaxID=1679460 RepID=UPI000B527E89|nr:DUF982 domain-containing protein [Marinibacterium profundimaris]MAU94937.1 DUF982 domain-containing protein [Fulvimarina sp.]
MIEINWGTPLTYVVSQDGDTKKFTTIEQARYWLRKKWPVADHHRDRAIDHVDAAMQCLAPVDAARQAFARAAQSAGFVAWHDTAAPA